MKAIRVHQCGGPEALIYEEVLLPEPGPGEVRVKVEAAGVNYIDTYHRTGLYPLPTPFTLGMEGAGVVDIVAPDVTLVKPGDRVAWCMARGAYAEYAVVPANKMVPIPATITTEVAAALILQGMTAHYLALSTYPLKPGDTALIHAAAGGVGSLLVQVAKRAGATVYGTVGSEDKAELARQAGADEVILYREDDFEAEVQRLTGGRGVDVVYDSVGATTFDKSLNCLRPRGLLALFGQSSGPVPLFNLQVLNQKGSLFVTRPTLGHYIQDRRELISRAGDVFIWAAGGELAVRIDRTLPLSQAAEAHRLLESRQTAGKVLLLPNE
ncbi:MAG: quinone oxidoreductase [Anaerolineae bacterium]|nr:quinone oxidoreductase [Anaerolineae bacterium]MCB0252783.1 quinone oxidoreductase [Anaerolineae bacterium]